MLDGGLSEFVLAKGTCCSQRTSPPQLVTAAWGHQYQFYDVRVWSAHPPITTVKLESCISMVQSAKNRMRNNVSEPPLGYQV